MSATLLLRRLIEQAGGDAGRYLLVIDGEGLEELPPEMITPEVTYSVARVGTEIGLRHLLWKAHGAPLIAVMPETLATQIQKAPDILRRARNQRVHALSVNDILEVVLGVRVVGAETTWLQQLALEHLDTLNKAMSNRTLPTVVDRRLLTELLVDASVGERVRTCTPAQLLAAWAESPPDWPESVSRLVREALPTMHGDAGRVLSWGLKPPATRLRELLVRGAVLTVDDAELPQQTWGDLWRAATEPPLEMDRRILRRTVTRLVEETLDVLGDRAAPFLEEANAVGRNCLTPSQIMTSRVLPLAFDDRAHALAQTALKGAALAASEIAWLASHAMARTRAAEIRVLELMARLSRYLDRPSALEHDLLAQVNAYQTDGAFADLTIAALRRALAGCAQFHSEATKIIEAVRERRNRENQHFAETLAAGYEAALHHEGMIPLHRLWKRTVAPIWVDDAKARLFVVVLDGCSTPVFLELLEALAQDAAFPIGLRADAEDRVHPLPGISPLPTVTSHARGAIFLGELPNDTLVAETVFRDVDEAKTDPARFNQNAALGERSRRLFLKGDLADGGQALLAALADESIAVVATVFNAIDDQIGSSNTGAPLRIAPADIAAFKPSLRAALQAGRKVLVTADHGHSPFIDKRLRVGAGKTPRYCTLAPGDAPPDGWMEIDVGALGGPPERRAFAWRSGSYMGQPQVGFHGGCSLEEMVVPVAWLERDGLQADEPSWWFGQGDIESRVTATPVVVAPYEAPLPSDTPVITDGAGAAAAKGAEAPSQLSFFEPQQKADTLPLPPALLERLGRDEKAVLVLLMENRSARATELAARLAKNPMRLNGLMGALRRTLHGENQVLFRSEVLTSGETMYVWVGTESANGSGS